MNDQINKAREAAERLRPLWPEKAAEIDRAVDDLLEGKRESLNITTEIKFKLEKYDGEYSPDKTPVEVIEGVG